MDGLRRKPDLDPLPTLTTSRFVLRALEPSDVEAIFRIFSDLEVTRYWGHSTLVEMGQAADFIREAQEGFQSGQLIEWGIADRAGPGEVIGTCAFSGWSSEHRRAEIGYALRRDRWGGGVMAEVLPELLRFGFEEMDLNRIEADADPRNERSLKSLERLGFVREGYLRERYFVNGELQDAILFSLLRRDRG
jgi:ribosomal-protein-alanine N-acetyltransferase